MKLIYTVIFITLFFIFFTSCSNKNNTLEIHYLKEGKLCSEIIPVNVLNDKGLISTAYIDSITFARFDSIVYEDGNPDKSHLFSTPVKLDFTKKIEPYSPEYYSIYTAYYVNKAINYYNTLFNGKIDFNSQAEYKSLKALFADIPLFTTPKEFYFEQGSNPSPSLFYHEVGHRAFWYIEDELGVKFKGLSLIHMGLLEYFTVSLNNSSIVGEDVLPPLLLRNAAFIYNYPPMDSLNLGNTLKLMAESYPEQMKDTTSIIYKIYKVENEFYKDYFHIIDNHRGGMILTSTLWRIRESLGQTVTDMLVAESILSLNNSMDRRNDFYTPDSGEVVPQKIEWYDLYYTLLEKDKEINKGAGYNSIYNEFQKTGYPVEKVKM